MMLQLRNWTYTLGMLLVYITTSAESVHYTLTSSEWENYKTLFGKSYANRVLESYALFNYNYNRKLIARHNTLYEQGLRTYKLAVNQFSDLRLISFNAMFPTATPRDVAYSSARPDVAIAPDTFDPASDFGFNFIADDQGVLCNSGWAYASAKAIQLKWAYQSNQLTPEPLSAQSLIDCAGQSLGCRNQVPQAAFDYLTQFDRLVYWAEDYPNDKTQAEQGMCLPPASVANLAEVRVSEYSTIPDGNDVLLQQYVGNSLPVVVEFNPTSFEFMHYAEGVFQQPHTARGSHFMTVVGYGTEVGVASTLSPLGISTGVAQNRSYWLLLNSFGETWGEKGFMRFARSASAPLAKSAIFPKLLA